MENNKFIFQFNFYFRYEKMMLSKCSLVVLLLLATNAYSVELQASQSVRPHFRPLRQRMRNASDDEVQNRINRRVQVTT
jgi:hypothetical protein